MTAFVAFLLALGAVAGVWLAVVAVARPRNGLERVLGVVALLGAGLGFLAGISS